MSLKVDFNRPLKTARAATRRVDPSSTVESVDGRSVVRSVTVRGPDNQLATSLPPGRDHTPHRDHPPFTVTGPDRADRPATNLHPGSLRPPVRSNYRRQKSGFEGARVDGRYVLHAGATTLR